MLFVCNGATKFIWSAPLVILPIIINQTLLLPHHAKMCRIGFARKRFETLVSLNDVKTKSLRYHFSWTGIYELYWIMLITLIIDQQNHKLSNCNRRLKLVAKLERGLQSTERNYSSAGCDYLSTQTPYSFLITSNAPGPILDITWKLHLNLVYNPHCLVISLFWV